MVETQRRGSISAAADACQVGQPSATKHLKTLESALGEPLLRRRGRGMALTEAGALVANHAALILGSLNALDDELTALRHGERGTLAIAASTTPATHVLPSVLKCFAERHPGIDVSVAIGPSADVIRRVATREVQLGIAGEMPATDAVIVEPFLDDEQAQTLLVREQGSSTRQTAERFLARAGVHPTKTWELDSKEAIKRAVMAGLGIGVLSRLLVEEEPEHGLLSAFSLADGERMTRPIQLLRAHDRHLTPSERAFIRTLTQCCSTLIPACAAQPT